MNMDNTTELEQRLAMAKALFSGLRGVEVDARTRTLSAEYSRSLLGSPWVDETDTDTRAYAARFFGSLQELAKATSLIERWRFRFDADNNPLDPDQARAFISDFFRVQYHQPRNYHDFT